MTSSPNPMQHPRIDHEHVVDRYLAGELTDDQEARFEEHLFECPACLEQVRHGEALRRGVQALATGESETDPRQDAEVVALRPTSTATSTSTPRATPRAWPGWGRLAAALIGVTLAVVLLWLSLTVLRQQRELDTLRATATQTGTGTGTGTGTSTQTGPLSQPVGHFAVVSLGLVRDASTTADGVQVRTLPDEPLLLSLELPAVEASRYRVTIFDAADREQWRGSGLRPNLYESLALALPADFLAPGTYRIVVEAEDAPTPAAPLQIRIHLPQVEEGD